MPISTCLNCNKEFRWNPSQKNGNYCCLDCQITDTLDRKIQTGTYTRSNAFTWHKRKRKYECVSCGINEYNGKPIRLQIDHIDGNNNNNVVENLRYLCPNCHTQTETWGVKNVSEDGRRRMNEGGIKGNKIKNGLVV